MKSRIWSASDSNGSLSPNKSSGVVVDLTMYTASEPLNVVPIPTTFSPSINVPLALVTLRILSSASQL